MGHKYIGHNFITSVLPVRQMSSMHCFLTPPLNALHIAAAFALSAAAECQGQCNPLTESYIGHNYAGHDYIAAA